MSATRDPARAGEMHTDVFGRRTARLRKNRLLAGTAIVTGAVVVTFGMSGQAQAGCSQLNDNPDEYACSVSGGSYTANPDDPWSFLVAGTVDSPLTPYDGTGQLVINNNSNEDGTFQMNDPSTLIVDNAHAFLLNGGTGSANTVTLNVGGDIDTTQGSDGNYDAMRLNGWTLNVNVLGTSSIIGADDAIVVLQAMDGVTVDVANGASVTGTDGNGTNGGEALLVAVGGAPGAGGQIAGFVTVHNHGNMTGNSDLNTGPTTSGGPAMSLSAAGPIDVTNESDGTLMGTSGVYANSSDNITVTNLGSVQSTKSTGAGVYFDYNGGDSSDSVTIKNLSTASMFGVGSGILGSSDGAPVLIYNGDGEAPNPDGLIDVTEVGISVENTNGAPITIYNGNSSDSASQIFAGGKYGIYARTRADPGDTGDDTVSIFNYGLVEAWGKGADAAVYARSSGDLPGYAAVYNGALNVGVEVFNPNARINAYGITPDPHSGETGDTADGVNPQIYDADGVVVVKHGNIGTLPLDILYDGEVLGSAYPFGAVVKNYGVWDFSRPDDYLTPGFNNGKAGFGYEGTTGGIFAPGGKAIKIRYTGDGTGDTGVWNYGTVIGQGSHHDPVIDITTTYNSSIQQEGKISLDNGNFVYIYNDATGLIGSANTPYGWNIYGAPLGLDDLEAVGAGYFAGGNLSVDWGWIYSAIDSGFLATFADASNDHLLNANWKSGKGPSGADVWIDNQGLLIGRIQATTGQDNLDTITFNNDGAWFVTGRNRFYGGPEDALNNWGVMQTAFDSGKKEHTSFKGLNDLNNYGILSMIDGGAGDHTYTSGEYYGGGIELVDNPGYLGVDVKFGQPWDNSMSYQEQKDQLGKSDKLIIGDYATGWTGVVINPVNDTPGGINEDGITVVKVLDDVGGDNYCNQHYNNVCQYGDIFFISDQSYNYMDVNGIGTVQDGLFTWYMVGVGEPILVGPLVGAAEGDPSYVLMSTDAPAGDQLAAVVGQAQGLWYQTDDVVADHLRGNQFPGGSAGGDGMMSDTSPKTGLWVKAVGAWTNRDTTVDDSILGPIDTGYDQDTYGLLAGADMRPGSGDGPMRLGVFGGYVNSSGKFDVWGTTAKYEGGTVGAYLDFIGDNGMYADATVKADFLNLDYSGPLGLTTASAHATNVGVRGNIGYRMQGANAFFEPIVSGTFVSTNIGDMTTPGATIDFSNGQSARAGAGVRVGTALGSPGGSTAELSLLAKAWYEFEPANMVTITDMFAHSDTYTDGIEGLFGQAEATLSVYSADRMTSGFISGGVEGNNDFLTLDAKGGLRRNF